MEAGLPVGTVLVCLCFFFKALLKYSTFVYSLFKFSSLRGLQRGGRLQRIPRRPSAGERVKEILALALAAGRRRWRRTLRRALLSSVERVGESWVAHDIKWTRSASPCNGCILSTARCSSSPGRSARRAVELALPFHALRTWRCRAGRLDRSTSMIAWCVELDRPSARRCCAAGLAANASATPLSISTFSL